MAWLHEPATYQTLKSLLPFSMRRSAQREAHSFTYKKNRRKGWSSGGSGSADSSGGAGNAGWKADTLNRATNLDVLGTSVLTFKNTANDVGRANEIHYSNGVLTWWNTSATPDPAREELVLNSADQDWKTFFNAFKENGNQIQLNATPKLVLAKLNGSNSVSNLVVKPTFSIDNVKVQNASTGTLSVKADGSGHTVDIDAGAVEVLAPANSGDYLITGNGTEVTSKGVAVAVAGSTITNTTIIGDHASTLTEVSGGHGGVTVNLKGRIEIASGLTTSAINVLGPEPAYVKGADGKSIALSASPGAQVDAITVEGPATAGQNFTVTGGYYTSDTAHTAITAKGRVTVSAVVANVPVNVNGDAVIVADTSARPINIADSAAVTSVDITGVTGSGTTTTVTGGGENLATLKLNEGRFDLAGLSDDITATTTTITATHSGTTITKESIGQTITIANNGKLAVADGGTSVTFAENTNGGATVRVDSCAAAATATFTVGGADTVTITQATDGQKFTITDDASSGIVIGKHTVKGEGVVVTRKASDLLIALGGEDAAAAYSFTDGVDGDYKVTLEGEALESLTVTPNALSTLASLTIDVDVAPTNGIIVNIAASTAKLIIDAAVAVTVDIAAIADDGIITFKNGTGDNLIYTIIAEPGDSPYADSGSGVVTGALSTLTTLTYTISDSGTGVTIGTTSTNDTFILTYASTATSNTITVVKDSQ